MFVQGKEEKEREAKENLGRRESGTWKRGEGGKKEHKEKGKYKNGKIRERNRKITKSRLGGIEPDSRIKNKERKEREREGQAKYTNN